MKSLNNFSRDKNSHPTLRGRLKKLTLIKKIFLEIPGEIGL